MDNRIFEVIVAVAALHVLVLGSMFLIQHGCKKGPSETSLARPEPAPPIPPSPPSAPSPGGVQSLPPTAYPQPPPAPPIAAPPLAPAAVAKVYTLKQGDT